jgi:hypothetical protein
MRTMLGTCTALVLIFSAGSSALALTSGTSTPKPLPGPAGSNVPAPTKQKPERAGTRQLQLPDLLPRAPAPSPRPQIQFNAGGSSRGDFDVGVHYADPQRGINGGASAAIPPNGSPTVGADFSKRVGPNTTLGWRIQTGPSGNEGNMNLNHEFK